MLTSGFSFSSLLAGGFFPASWLLRRGRSIRRPTAKTNQNVYWRLIYNNTNNQLPELFETAHIGSACFLSAH